jgi:hypothetical protein
MLFIFARLARLTSVERDTRLGNLHQQDLGHMHPYTDPPYCSDYVLNQRLSQTVGEPWTGEKKQGVLVPHCVTMD